MSSQTVEVALPTTAVDARRRHRLRSRAARVLFFSGTLIGFTLGYVFAWLLPANHLIRTDAPNAHASAAPTKGAKAVATPAIRKTEIPSTSVRAINTTPSPAVVLLNPGTAGETLNEPFETDVHSPGMEQSSPLEFQRGIRKKSRAQVD
jgi:hypothetical protein